MACKNNINDIQVLNDKFKSLNIISENWVVVDKSENNENSHSCPLSEDCCKTPEKSLSTTVPLQLRPYVPFTVEDKSENNEIGHSCPLSEDCCKTFEKPLSTTVPLQLRPYVPFTVEELSFATTLDTWSNCNVRVIGLLQMIEGKYFLESVNEPGGPYRVLLVFKCMKSLQSSNQVVQVFGEIKLIHENDNTKPFISVLFFRNLKVCDLSIYTKAVEEMRQYIPLFLNTERISENSDDIDSQYYHYHKLCNDEDDVIDDDDYDDNSGVTNLYCNDDFNYQYNTDI